MRRRSTVAVLPGLLFIHKSNSAFKYVFSGPNTVRSSGCSRWEQCGGNVKKLIPLNLDRSPKCGRPLSRCRFLVIRGCFRVFDFLRSYILAFSVFGLVLSLLVQQSNVTNVFIFQHIETKLNPSTKFSIKAQQGRSGSTKTTLRRSGKTNEDLDRKFGKRSKR
jgi:hypothetical protein